MSLASHRISVNNPNRTPFVCSPLLCTHSLPEFVALDSASLLHWLPKNRFRGQMAARVLLSMP